MTKTKKSKKTLAAPFLITVAGAAAIALPACGSTIETITNPPPPPACPDLAPAQGEPCEEAGQVCEYPDECSGTYTATCIAGPSGAAWATSVNGPPCNPPPPEFCLNYTTSDQCEADSFCRWMVPGCGDAPLAAPGCYPAMGCDVDTDCLNGGTCQKVSVVPECAQANCNPCCDSCGETVGICM